MIAWCQRDCQCDRQPQTTLMLSSLPAAFCFMIWCYAVSTKSSKGTKKYQP